MTEWNPPDAEPAESVSSLAGALEERGVDEDAVPILEALLFAAGEPVTREEMEGALTDLDPEEVGGALDRLLSTYREEGRGLQIVQVAGGYRMVTRSVFDRFIRALHRQRNRHRLGRAALETLAIVAYRQPITAPEICEIRGKDSSAVLKGLLDKRLLRVTGRKRVVGKPFLYGTTRQFLLHFGLNSLEDLPSMAEFESLLDAQIAAAGLDEELPLGSPEGPLVPEQEEVGPELLEDEAEPGEEE